MSNAISKTLDEIFGGADEIIGSHAPYEMDAERRFVSDAREAVEEALSMLPPAVKVALASKLKAATTIRDRTIKEEEAIWNEIYADPKPRGRGPNKARA
jgi:hypothetical protein